MESSPESRHVQHRAHTARIRGSPLSHARARERRIPERVLHLTALLLLLMLRTLTLRMLLVLAFVFAAISKRP